MSALQHLSDRDLGQLVLQALIKEGCPVSDLNDLSLLGMDTSREGLLDLIAGTAAMLAAGFAYANATPVDES